MIPEHTADKAFHGELEVRILEYNIWGFTAKLECDVLQVGLCCHLHDLAPNHRGPCERNLVDALVLRNSISDGMTVASNDVHDAGREAGLVDE